MSYPLRPRATRQQMLDKAATAAKDVECRKLLDKAENPPKEKK